VSKFILHPRTHHPTVHVERCPVDVRGGITGKENGVGDIVRFPDAEMGNLIEEVLHLAGVAELVFGETRSHHAGSHRIDVDVVARAVHGDALRHPLSRALAGIGDGLFLCPAIENNTKQRPPVGGLCFQFWTAAIRLSLIYFRARFTTNEPSGDVIVRISPFN
jgi:hypothetical protein